MGKLIGGTGKRMAKYGKRRARYGKRMGRGIFFLPYSRNSEGEWDVLF